MIISKILSANFTQAVVFFAVALSIQTSTATELNMLSSSPETQPGSTAMISIDPVLPKQGESFSVNVTGVWGNPCIPEQSDVTYEISEFPEHTRIYYSVTQNLTAECSNKFEPTPYELSITIQGSDREKIDNSEGLLVFFKVIEPPSEFSVPESYWSRIFDLTLGLHEIPPWLGSGYWLSDGAPFQGLLIQQQGNTVVFYELAYNRISGEPNWHYATGKFDGSALNGVAYLVNWLSPVAGINPEYGSGLVTPRPNLLVQPTRDELLFEASSGSLSVYGVNHIRGFLGYVDGAGIPNYNYRRWVFGQDNARLPPVVPDMVGRWNLYGFMEQELKQFYEIEFGAGVNAGNDLYHFSSTNDEWTMECKVSLGGSGACALINEGLGLAMTYDLDSYPYDHTNRFNTHFNGNYAKAPLVNSINTEPDQVGILLKSGLRLPVLDLD